MPIIEKVKSAFPKKQDVIPIVTAMAIAQLGKLPEYAIQGATTVAFYEVFKNEPGLVPLGLVMYGLFSAAEFAVGYRNLLLLGGHAGIKSSSLMVAMNLISPGHRRFNAFMAETGNTLVNIIGVTNPVGFLSDIAALLSSDLSVVFAHRSSVVVSGVIGLVTNIGLNLYKKHHG